MTHDQALLPVLERLAACESDLSCATEGGWAVHEIHRIAALLDQHAGDDVFDEQLVHAPYRVSARLAYELLELLGEQMWGDVCKFCRRAVHELEIAQRKADP